MYESLSPILTNLQSGAAMAAAPTLTTNYLNGQAMQAAGGPGLWDQFTGLFQPNVDQATGVATPSAVSTGLNTLSGLANTWMGIQQYNLAKDAFKENKRQFNLNYNAQKKNYNSSIEDRQRARVAANPGAYESVGSYMQKNGL